MGKASNALSREANLDALFSPGGHRLNEAFGSSERRSPASCLNVPYSSTFLAAGLALVLLVGMRVRQRSLTLLKWFTAVMGVIY